MISNKELSEKIVDYIKKSGITTVYSLPCDRLKHIFTTLDQDENIIHRPLNREENGIGITSGINLIENDPKSMLLIQSTGLANCLNAILSLPYVYEIPLPIMVSWRGNDFNDIEAQIPLGFNLIEVLQSLDIGFTIIKDEYDLPNLEDSFDICRKEKKPHIILLDPKIWHIESTQSKTWEKNKLPMNSYEIMQFILGNIPDDDILITNIGHPCKMAYEIKDRENTFYMLGSLGQASALGIGIADRITNDVYVIDGDGSLQISNILTMLAHSRLDNLKIIVLDNGVWGSTGCQPIGFDFIDIENLAKANGIENTHKISTREELSKLFQMVDEKGGVNLYIIKCKEIEYMELDNVPITAVKIADRIRKNWNGEEIE